MTHLWGEWVLFKRLALVPRYYYDSEAHYIVWMAWVFRIERHVLHDTRDGEK